MSKAKKELLITSSGFPNESGDYLAHTFVKGYVDEAKNYYSKVIVLVILPYVPLLLKKFANKYNKLVRSYSYENVSVVYKRYPYIPLWPFNKYKGKIAYLFLSSQILRMVKKETIIHANFTSPAGVFTYFLSKKVRKDFTLTVHEDHNWLVEEINSKNQLLVNTWKKAKTIIRVNQLDNGLLAQFNEKIITIPNGFNHRKFRLLDKKQCKKQLNIVGEKKIIVNIGFYNNQKNQKLLIDAIRLLSDEIRNNLECFIIGGGPKQGELENHVMGHGMTDIIKIVGQVDHDKLPLYLNSADIFCLSSNSEGNPTVMFEALGVGIPYIGSSVGGVPEIIVSEKYGLLCDPGKKEELKEVIEKGLKKNWNRNEIIEYSEQFSWEKIFLKTKQNY